MQRPDPRFLALIGAALVALLVIGAVFGLKAVVGALALAVLATVGSVLATHHIVSDQHEKARAQVQAIVALDRLLAPRAPLPAMTGWAGSPELMMHIVREVLRRRPKVILEAGSGVSTLIHAYVLDKLGEGAIVSLEHDADFARESTRDLRLHGLERWALVHHAPLVKHRIQGQEWLWYDMAALPDDLVIDMLVIDGPPWSTQSLARYPALPLLADRLADGAVIILDDADRAGERAVVARWLREYPSLTHHFVPTLKGTSILVWTAAAAMATATALPRAQEEMNRCKSSSPTT
jgi:predicted O-methyltransferase YrrM